MEWLTFAADVNELSLGKEVELIIKDLTPGPRKYDSHRVLAVVSETPAPETDVLCLKLQTGRPHPTPFGIRVLKEIELVPWKSE